MEEHQARCNEIQVLKFGQLIDLEMVDKVSSGMSQEEARRRVEAIEDKHAIELARLEERNRELRSSLLESTYENTKRLREVADLSSRQFTLEKVWCHAGDFCPWLFWLHMKDARAQRYDLRSGGGWCLCGLSAAGSILCGERE